MPKPNEGKLHVACAMFGGDETLLTLAEQARNTGKNPCKNHPDCQTCEREEVLSKVSVNLDPSIVTPDD